MTPSVHTIDYLANWKPKFQTTKLKFIYNTLITGEERGGGDRRTSKNCREKGESSVIIELISVVHDLM